MGAARASHNGATLDAKLAEITNRLYDTALNQAAWKDHLERLKGALESDVCAIGSYNFETRSGGLCCATGLESRYVKLYEDSLNAKDIWFREESLFRGLGTILTNRDIVSDETLLSSEFYQAWMKPQGFHHRLCAVVGQNDRSIRYIVAYRGREAAEYGSMEVGILRTLTPHLHRTVEFYRILVRIEEERDVALEALNHLNLGVIVVDGERKLLAANKRAHDLLGQGDGLVLKEGRLHASDAATTASLDGIIGSAVFSRSAESGRACGTLSLLRPSGRQSLSVRVRRITPEHNPLATDEPTAVVYVRDPEVDHQSEGAVLHEMYGLTPAERRLATHLAQGTSVAEAAQQLDISVGTARIHLKHIFSKTGTSRQGELVSLLLNGTTFLNLDFPSESVDH